MSLQIDGHSPDPRLAVGTAHTGGKLRDDRKGMTQLGPGKRRNPSGSWLQLAPAGRFHGGPWHFRIAPVFVKNSLITGTFTVEIEISVTIVGF